MRVFLRKTAGGRDPLPITMSGVRMGERVLQIGVDDPRMAGAIAAKVGLSGHAAIAVPDDTAAKRAQSGAAEAGGLLDVQVTNLDALPFETDSFDAVVIHNVGPLLATLGHRIGSALAESLRVLRSGGRIIVIEGGTPAGLTAMFGGAKNAGDDGAGTMSALQAAGFKPVRLLADREGLRFVEGLKTPFA